jgi:hypothetical protein
MYIRDPARVTYFGQTDARNKRMPFGIKAEDRSRHFYVIGKTGMGKSTLLENMAVQDIKNGEGVCFIDPHGSTAEKLLEYIPEERLKDVLYFAPFDLSYPISFNVMENVDPDKRHLVINGLMATFEKIWEDAWSARMSYILQNTIGALLEYPGATLLGINRMYIDKDYRKKVVDNITDPTIRSFWVEEYTKFTDRYTQEATPAIQNKIGQFSSNPLIRNIIGQPTSSFDIREIMDQRKIFIVNLSKGRVGEGNANLLGSMLITKIYLAAMSRADLAAKELALLPPLYLFVDEFQSFANKSFADILSEARKYKLALTMAHQYIEQMEEEVRAAVFGNVGTMVTFRVGSYDAEVLEKEFAPTFTAVDIVNLASRQIYLKLMIDGVSSSPFSATTLPPIDLPAETLKEVAIAFSRKNYSRPRSEVEAEIVNWHKPVEPAAGGVGEQRPDRRAERPRDQNDRPRDRGMSERPRTTPERTAVDLRATLETIASPKPAPSTVDSRARGRHEPRPERTREHPPQHTRPVMQQQSAHTPRPPVTRPPEPHDNQPARPAVSVPTPVRAPQSAPEPVTTEAQRNALRDALAALSRKAQAPDHTRTKPAQPAHTPSPPKLSKEEIAEMLYVDPDNPQ